MRATLLALLVGCTGVPKNIAVTGDQELGRDAIEGWGALGFTYASDARDADIVIEVRRETYVSNDCRCEVLGHAAGTTVWIDPKLSGDALRHNARHEFGHVMLQSMHLESYGAVTDEPWAHGVGIMNASPYRDGTPTWITEPTSDDYAMACYTIGICIE